MSKTKRFIVFEYPAYYPGGGWSDFKESFDTYNEAEIFADALKRADNIEIIDLDTGENLYIYPTDRTQR